MADVEFTVKAIDQATAALHGIRGALLTLNQGLQAAQVIYGQLKRVVDSTVGAYVNYANEVRKLQQLNGGTAEDMSRLIQITDDYKVSTNDLAMATKKLAAEGKSLTTETLAQLSDEYLKLGSNAERAQFLFDKFGRSGASLAEIMQQGGDAIRSESAAVSGSLVLTDKAVKKAREYEKAQDALADATDALNIELGQKFLPTLTKITQAFAGTVSGGPQALTLLFQGRFREAAQVAADALIQVGLATNNMSDDLEDSVDSFGEAEQAAEDFAQKLSNIVNFAGTYRGAMENLRDAQAEYAIESEKIRRSLQFYNTLLTDGGATLEWYKQHLDDVAAEYGVMSDEYLKARDELDNIGKAYETAGGMVGYLNGKLEEQKQKVLDAQQAVRDAVNEMVAGFLQEQLAIDGTFTEEDMQKVLNFRLATGLLTESEYAAAQAALQLAQNIAMLGNKEIYVTTHYVSVGGGGGSGGGTGLTNPSGGATTGGGGGGAGQQPYWVPDPNNPGHYMVNPNMGHASGGSVGIGGWAMVGDAPGGRRTPYTEYIHVTPWGTEVYNQSQMSGRSAPPMQTGGFIPPAMSKYVDLSPATIRAIADAMFQQISKVL